MLAPVLDQPGGAASADRALPTPTPTLTAPAGSARPAATQAIVWQGPPAKSKLEECLRCIYAMMKRKVISSPKDLIGILVWNTVGLVWFTICSCSLSARTDHASLAGRHGPLDHRQLPPPLRAETDRRWHDQKAPRNLAA